MPRVLPLLALLFIAAVASSRSAPAADNWPDFRGPKCNGHAAATNLPVRCSEADWQNIRWKTAIHGKGWSSPVVWDRQVWLTTATEDGKRLYAVAVDRDTGEIVHDRLVFEIAEPELINPINTYASPSPVIEEGRVYVHFGTYGTACLDTATGKTLWQRRDLRLQHKEGPGSSPILYENLLIVNCDGMDVRYVIALDKQTGQTVWKTNRTNDVSDVIPDQQKAYGTPIVIDVDGQKQLVSDAAHATFAYDPLTGRELWHVEYDGFSNVSRPIYDGRVVYLSTGFPRPQLWAVQPTGQGDVSDSHVPWRFERGVAKKPSNLLVGRRIFTVADKGGILTCLNADTGKPVWTQRLGGNFSASPILADDHIYLCSEEGLLTVFDPADEYREVATSQIDGGILASPAAVGQSLYVRTESHLYRIEKNAGGPQIGP